MPIILAIASGGALGAVLRHFVNLWVTQISGPNFPWGILFINILGSFFMGALVSVFAHMWDASQALRAFLTVGVLGAFTTFSAFSLDVVVLAERGETGSAMIYTALSVVLAVAALYAGMVVVRVLAS